MNSNHPERCDFSNHELGARFDPAISEVFEHGWIPIVDPVDDDHVAFAELRDGARLVYYGGLQIDVGNGIPVWIDLRVVQDDCEALDEVLADMMFEPVRLLVYFRPVIFDSPVDFERNVRVMSDPTPGPPPSAKDAVIEQWHETVEMVPDDSEYSEFFETHDIHDEEDRHRAENVIFEEMGDSELQRALADAFHDLRNHFSDL